MRVYGQYCPVAQGSEIVGDRWTPLILREMMLGSTRFNDIERGLPGISRTLLTQRLRHLDRKGVIEIRTAAGRGHDYVLTPAGADLEPVLTALGEWTVRWMLAEPDEADCDPLTLTWWLHKRIDAARLPDKRVVIEFRYAPGAVDGLGGPAPATGRRTLWMVLDAREQNVCLKHPGFDSDVLVSTDAVSFMRVFSGLVTLGQALRDQSVVIDGPPVLTRAFPTWFLWSPFHGAVRERVTHPAGA
jgi:DNA-binding HxlR family transcriptional regulator